MRNIALFLLSSILTPATLAAGQGTCLLATQIKVMTALPADNSIAGWTVTSNSSGSCVARPVDDIPMRPAASRQTMTSQRSTTESNAVAVMESLLARLGWTDLDESAFSARPARLRMKDSRARASKVAEGAARQQSFSVDRVENAVIWF